MYNSATEELHPASMYRGLIQPATNRSPYRWGADNVLTLTGGLYRVVAHLVGIRSLLVATAGSRAGCCAMQNNELGE